jgi:hypothetical protein
VLGTCTDKQATEIKSLSTVLNKILAILKGKPAQADKPIQSKEAPIQQAQRATSTTAQATQQER